MILPAYRTLTTLGGPLIRLYLARRLARGKEDPVRFPERLGQAGLARPAGSLIWVHAASVGESLSLLPLLDRLRARYPSIGLLMTTGTVTSAALLAERLPPGVLHQYVPVDRPAYVRRFLDHWRPDLALWAESEFWPNLITQTAARGVPLILVQGRISDRSYARWRRHGAMIRQLLAGFVLCLGQTDEDARRLSDLGAADARSLGNLKLSAPPLPADGAEFERLGAILGARPRWLAASTHAGEEDLIGRVHARLKADHPGLLSMIVPRHPNRGSDIAAALADTGLTVARRAAGDEIGPGTDVYVADTMGELGLFYRLAGIVFVGKSLVPLGGQNPLEPARLDGALVFGPYMDNFRELAVGLMDAGAAEEVADEDALVAAVARLLSDPAGRERRARAAAAFADARAGVLDDVLAVLDLHMAPLEGAHRHARA